MQNQDTLTQRAAKSKNFDFTSLGHNKSRTSLLIDVSQLQKKNIMHTKLQGLNMKTETSESCTNSNSNSNFQSFLSPHRKLLNKKPIIKSKENELILDHREKQFLIDTFQKKSPQEMQEILQEQKKQYEQEKQKTQKELEQVIEEYNQHINNSVKMSENEFQIKNANQLKRMQTIEQEKNDYEQMIAQSQITLDSIQIKEFCGDQEKLYQELENMWKQFKLENKKEYNDYKKGYNPLKLNVLLQQ